MAPSRSSASPASHAGRPRRRTLRVGALAAAFAVGLNVGLASEAAAQNRSASPADSVRIVNRWLEAEDAEFDRPLRVEGDDDASGGAYVAADDRHSSRTRPPRDGRARLPFTLDADGAYRLLGRVGASGDEEDSFWLRVDDGPWIRWNGLPHTGGWRWAPVTDADRGAGAIVLDLARGNHMLTFAYREGGARLDRLLLTNDPTLAPDGPGPAPPRVQVFFRNRSPH